MTSKECGEFIAVLRKEKNLTQKQLAEKMNVSDKAISRWETGKGYPDVTSLLALSDYFELSVNELLAGKRIKTENIAEIADENIISAFKEKENSRKKQNVQIVLYTVILLLILLPVLVLIIKEMSVIVTTQLQTENIIPSVIQAVISLLLLISGLVIKSGNISIIHSYHYKNVTDFGGYTREMGNGFMLLSLPVFISAFMTLFAHIKAVEIISAVLLFAGVILCLVYIFRIQIKYNGGLF